MSRWDPAGPVPEANFTPLGSSARILSLAWKGLRTWADTLRSGAGWTHLPMGASQSSSALTQDQVPASSGFYLPCFRYDQDNDLSVVFTMPNEWDGGIVAPVLRIIPLSNAIGTVGFNYSVQWLLAGRKVTSFPAVTVVQQSLGLIHRYQRLTVALGKHAPPAGAAGPNASFLIKVVRKNSDDSYNYTKGWGTTQANVALLSLDLYYRRHLFGDKESA